jgi:hypothetical protein
MAVLGKSMAEFAPDTVLVGVAPHLKLKGHGASEEDADAEYAEPRHRMIRTSGDAWGSEGQTLVRGTERLPIVPTARGLRKNLGGPSSRMPRPQRSPGRGRQTETSPASHPWF